MNVFSFSLHVVHSYQFHYVYSLSNIETSFICTHMYSIIRFHMFWSIYNHFHIFHTFNLKKKFFMDFYFLQHILKNKVVEIVEYYITILFVNFRHYFSYFFY